MAGDPYPWGLPRPFDNTHFMSASISESALSAALASTLRSSVRDLAAFEQLKHVIVQHILTTRELDVYAEAEEYPAMVLKAGNTVFESFSWAACIEWALKQPVISQEPKGE